jgi:hypothetical protein
MCVVCVLRRRVHSTRSRIVSIGNREMYDDTSREIANTASERVLLSFYSRSQSLTPQWSMRCTKHNPRPARRARRRSRETLNYPKRQDHHHRRSRGMKTWVIARRARPAWPHAASHGAWTHARSPPYGTCLSARRRRRRRAARRGAQLRL